MRGESFSNTFLLTWQQRLSTHWVSLRICTELGCQSLKLPRCFKSSSYQQLGISGVIPGSTRSKFAVRLLKLSVEMIY